jgi:hypothetical protein
MDDITSSTGLSDAMHIPNGGTTAPNGLLIGRPIDQRNGAGDNWGG